MKNFFLPAVVAAFTLASTASSAQIFSSGFPNPTEQDQRKRDKDDRRRDSDDRKIDRDGRGVYNERNLPPGQAKKVYGGKSAKVYAPGQRKKQGNGAYSNLPERISVNDRDVRRAANGQLYYSDGSGNVYWKGKDGYFYLDNSSVNNRDNDRDDYNRYEQNKTHQKHKKHTNHKEKSKRK